MDKQEAKLVLQALRPNKDDLSQPAFADALALAGKDPELKAWWEAQQSFDRKIAAKLKEIPVPDDLRATILAGRKIEPIRQQPLFSFWLAAAAVVAILCALGTSQYFKMFGPVSRGEYTAAILPLVDRDAPTLGMESNDPHQVMAWLKTRNAPLGKVPPKMTNFSTVGCQKFFVHGHAVSLICFTMPDGGIAHLFMVNEQALTDPPGENTPEMNEVNGWSTAAWSDGHMSYVLATQCGNDALKQLL